MSEESETNAEVASRVPTERVILERVRALVIPDAVTDEQVSAAIELLYGKAGKGRKIRVGIGATPEAWVEVGRETESSKKAAVELYAGKPGTADARVGTWRAPSVTAWKGAIVHEAPPAPLIESRVIE